MGGRGRGYLVKDFLFIYFYFIMVLFMCRLKLENFLTVGIWVISPLSMVNIKTEKEMFLKIKFWPIHQKKLIG